MSGIYLHIPYCKKVCYYCDFHFSASLKNKDPLLKALEKEIVERKDYLEKAGVNTIYFGGGTPSVLTLDEVRKLTELVFKTHSVNPDAEITFEANPDDLTLPYLKGLKECGINRLSIGIQSFSDVDLKWMNRRHNFEEALRSVKLSQDAGFSNLNVDLIYGLPSSSIQTWEKNLDIFSTLGVQHLSAYHLTIEPKTVLGVWKKRGKMFEVVEEESLREYKLLLDKTKELGYTHYEISNFCLDNQYSKHNVNYWTQGKYLGLGPSAHSYNEQSRRWNVALNAKYISAINNNEQYWDEEQLTQQDKFNDYLLTHLRTMWGIRISEVKKLFGDGFADYLQKEILRYKDTEYIEVLGDQVKLSETGRFISDRIISEWMRVE